MFASERDISCYIYQNIIRATLMLIYEKVPDIKVVLDIKVLDIKVLLRIG